MHVGVFYEHSYVKYDSWNETAQLLKYNRRRKYKKQKNF